MTVSDSSMVERAAIIPALIERLEKAEGLMLGVDAAGLLNTYGPWECESDEWRLGVKALSGDLNAALALVERVLPGWKRAVDATMPSAGIDVDLFPPHVDDPAHRRVVKGTHTNEAIATCIAALKAIAQTDGTKGGTKP